MVKVLANNIVLGVPDNNNVQRYAITMQKTTGTAETDIIYKNEPQNEPKDGKLKIYKYENGTTIPLKGAKFELRSLNGEISNIYTTDSSGQIVIDTIPDGDYILEEIEAPKNYSLSNEILDVEIEFPTQILKLNFTNKSLDLRTSIRKTGLQQVVAKQDVSYSIFDVSNSSTVSLDSFYWRDTLPNAIRATKLETGTYNMYTTYKIVGKTNTGRDIIIADNVSSLENRTIFLSYASLGLSSNEYLTDITCMFGTVNAGFKMTTNAKLTAKTVGNLPHDYEFANKVDVGGLYGSEWVVSNDTWVTSVYNPVTSIPKTGW